MGTCETVRIVANNKEGYFIINKCDKTPEQKEYKPVARRKAVRKKTK